MDLGFLKIIEKIETEIGHQYLPGAIQWIDDKHGNAWSKAMDRFDSALSTGDPQKMKVEGEVYKMTCIALLRIYKTEVDYLKQNEFFDELEKSKSP